MINFYRIKVILRAILVLLIALTLISCASIGPDKPFDSNEKSVTLVVNTADTFALQWIGTTIFNNKSGADLINDFNISKIIAENSEEVLEKTTEFKSVSITTALKYKELQNRKELNSLNADYMLVISDNSVQDIRFCTNRKYTGVGIFQRSLIGIDPNSVSHVALKAELIEVSSGKTIRTGYADQSTGGIILSKDMKFHDDQALAIKGIFGPLIKSTIEILLSNLGLRKAEVANIELRERTPLGNCF